MSDNGMDYPLYAFQMSKDIYIVCHGMTDDGQHRVCEISPEGKIRDSYGGLRGKGPDQLDLPIGAALTKDGQHILVADYVNARVLLLKRQPLRLHRVLIDEEHTGAQPTCLTLIDDTGRLCVGLSTQGVLIYKF